VEHDTIDKTLQELIDQQRRKLLRLANELGVRLTSEDILNPHDFPELQRSTRFHFEDGILAGLLSAQMALRNQFKP
jgi:hypothetical protein